MSWNKIIWRSACGIWVHFQRIILLQGSTKRHVFAYVEWHIALALWYNMHISCSTMLVRCLDIFICYPKLSHDVWMYIRPRSTTFYALRVRILNWYVMNVYVCYQCHGISKLLLSRLCSILVFGTYLRKFNSDCASWCSAFILSSVLSSILLLLNFSCEYLWHSAQLQHQKTSRPLVTRAMYSKPWKCWTRYVCGSGSCGYCMTQWVTKARRNLCTYRKF